jgi:DNA-binding transcriptional MerR regulator
MQSTVLKKIGEVAERLGTTPRALRFYEEEGLVSARRTQGGTRLYSDEDIARFQAILRLAHSGVSLALVKELATTREKFATGEQASQNVHSVLSRLRAQVTDQMVAMRRLELELSKAAKAIEGCFECGNPPTRKGCPDCPVNRLLGKSEILGLIWEQDVASDEQADFLR